MSTVIVTLGEMRKFADQVPEDLDEWRRLAATGMWSALGEYTPAEFVALCDKVDALRQRLEAAEAEDVPPADGDGLAGGGTE